MLQGASKPTQQWLDQKYSMFIHFGLYSHYGGIYNNRPVTQGYSEQIQSFAGIFSDWYEATTAQFAPTQWNPDSVVSLAKKAGMKSIVFTAKHHDGFCMYRSEHTKFNIVDATPYKRDILLELSQACQRGNIDFAVYFSLIDWHFPQAYPISSHNADPITPEHFDYNKKQVEEIMTRYGKISEIWFDMGALTPEQSQQLYNLVDTIQPQCMISGRLGNNYADFSVMADNEYPQYHISTPWQTAASMFNETWGYRQWQERGKVEDKVTEKIKRLVQVISHGGNYLLNIGPRGDGSIVEFEKNVLINIGKWIETNAEAIYKTKANPLPQKNKNIEITSKDNNLYLFIIEPTETIVLENILGSIDKVETLGQKHRIKFNSNQKKATIILDIPTKLLDTQIPVIKITFKNNYTIKPQNVIELPNKLTTNNALQMFSHASLDYYSGYKSLTAYQWHCNGNGEKINPTINFTQNNIDRDITLITPSKIDNIRLTPTDSTIYNLTPSSIVLGNLYTRPGRGIFGTVEQENHENITAEMIIQDKWQKIENFEYGKIYQQPLPTRRSIMLMQEIHSETEQNIAVKIGGGNGLYILLNGKYITAHCDPQRPDYQSEIVILPLKIGKNQLIIKHYNRFATTHQYSLEFPTQWIEYHMPIETVTTQKGIFDIILKANSGIQKVAPLRLNNLSITFGTKDKKSK